MPSLRVAIVLVNYNGLADTIECLHSIESCNDPHVRVIVVENGMEKEAELTIKDAFPKTTYVKSGYNAGWAGGNNIGIREALWPKQDSSAPAADVVFLLNNDTVLAPDIFRHLRDAFSKGYDVIGPIINDYHDRSTVQTEGIRFNSRASCEFFQYIPAADKDRHAECLTVTPVDIVNGCAVAISRRVFEKVGLIDERFFLICEESDFCLRAQCAGYKLGVTNRSLVFHKHSVSFERSGKPLQRYYGVRNLFLLLCKHRNGEGRRGFLASLVFYLRHVFRVYSHEIELNNPAGASAAIIGLNDGLLWRFGPRPIKPNWSSRVLEFTAFVAYKLRFRISRTRKAEI